MRLRPLTRWIAGDDRPKQFCVVLDGETLWAHTRRRAELVVPAERTLSVVTTAQRARGPSLHPVRAEMGT